MSRLLNISAEDLLELFSTFLTDIEDLKVRIVMSLFSLYLTYSLATNSYLDRVLTIAMQIISHYLNKITPGINTLRTQLMLIINHHIIVYGANTIFGIFNQSWPNYEGWFWPFIWTMGYLNHKYAL